MSESPAKRIAGRCTTAAALITVIAAACLGLWWFSSPRTAEQLEKAFARSGCHQVAISTELPQGRAGQTIAFTIEDLQEHQLFLRQETENGHWLHIDGQGQVHTAAGQIAVIERSAELLLGPSGIALFVDDVPQPIEDETWQTFWVSAATADTPPKAAVIPKLMVKDDFAREELEVHPYARITAGTVELSQRGGGMPTTAAEEADYSFQRAVNPFALHASDSGRLTYNVHSPTHWGDVHVEACFYFGIPKTGPVVDRGSLPTDTDMLVVIGPEDGFQAAFGWSGATESFVLLSRSGADPWSSIAAWETKRPPVTNWVKIALECRQGHQIVGLLDDVPVLSAELPRRLLGPFHIQGGAGLVEFDDVRAWSLPTPEPEATPLFVRSRQFAGKARKDKADPEEFDEWASSSHAFRRVRWRDAATRTSRAAIVTGEPIIGEFVCASPGERPPGAPSGLMHWIALYPAKPDRPLDIRKQDPVCMVRASRSDDSWTVKSREDPFAGPESDLTEPTLEVGRQRGRLCVRAAGRWLPLSGVIPGAVHLAIIRLPSSKARRRFLLSPSPTHHMIRCTNLVHELFEDAPTAWNWVDGAFRMDCRWACQDQWNFMACGSTGLPYMASKRVFTGDQVHEAFMCLRATFPWDAGDTTFTYDPDSDRANKFPILRAANAWYNRHDLNMAFCTDGKNPLSGYCVVFGGENNTVTRLLRAGVSVAESRRSQHLFRKDESFMVVHYPWWRLTVTKTDARIQVALDGEQLFDYTDPVPIEGGHVGFWSVRNGFAISRISSMAENIRWRRHAFYATGSTQQSWQPLVAAAVRLETDPDGRLTTVTNTFGGGFFAVRQVPDAPIDLRKRPRLQLPLRLGPGVRVNLHVEIGGKPFIVRLGDSPLEGMKAFLVPGSETGECFQLRPISESTVRRRHLLAELPGDVALLELNLLKAFRELAGAGVEPLLTCLTIGNSSNAGYLMGGNGANEADSAYQVGAPTFTE
ncbi:MAG: hypothetical protein HN742_43275 [Lentisphaerae bacterium]|jgi:hypothetical protein|nr:hypothetical protein [Lentisphaerota bacterium]MBT4820937.1 hypothetical protein [Lentisphaerota bacterium]MBT5609083.1 hypothetical protein [Lentisphaerota bacterium]MBT7057270.1 hypothetical protein [Lentisphaerota bacterium]MBT7848761.1 hypothetical protein [Lentisphaerota bacterium]